MPQKMDELLGANMVFALDDSAPHFANEVLKLQQMNGKTFVGWLFGGIKAEIPNLTPSSASKRMFKVFITPKNSVGTADALANTPALRISPNPFVSGQKINLETTGAVQNILLFNANGMLLGDFSQDILGLESHLGKAPAGIYFLQIMGENGRSMGKVLKMK